MDQSEATEIRPDAETPAISGWRRWLRPTQFDQLALTAVFVFGFAILIRGFIVGFRNVGNRYPREDFIYCVPYLAVVLAIVAAVTGLLMLKRLDWKRAILWILVVALSFGCSLAFRFVEVPESAFTNPPLATSQNWLEFFTRTSFDLTIDPVQSYLRLTPLELGDERAPYKWWNGVSDLQVVVASLFFTVLLAWPMAAIAGVTAKWLPRVPPFVKKYRTRILIAIMATLLVAHVGRIFHANFFPGRFSSWPLTVWTLLGVGYLFLAGLIFCPIVWLGSRGTSLRMNYLIGGLLSIFSFSRILQWILTVDEWTQYFLIGFVVAMTALLVPTVLWLAVTGMCRMSDQGKTGTPGPPTVFSFLIVLPLFAWLLWCANRYDTAAFAVRLCMDSRITALSSKQKIELALNESYRVRSLQTQTGGEITKLYHGNRISQRWSYFVKIRGPQDANILLDIDRILCSRYELTISDIQPFVNTNAGSAPSSFLVLAGGEPSAKQIADLNVTQLRLMNVDRLPQQAHSGARLEEVYFMGDQRDQAPHHPPENLAGFLSSHAGPASILWFDDFEFNLEQWQTIAAASQIGFVYVQTIPLVAFKDRDRSISLENLKIGKLPSGYSIEDPEVLEFLIETSLNCHQIESREWNRPREPWDYYVLGIKPRLPFISEYPDGDRFVGFADERNWVFDWDGSEPKAIWLPVGVNFDPGAILPYRFGMGWISKFSDQMQKVTHLRMFRSFQYRYAARFFDIDPLGKLPGLEILTLRPGDHYSSIAVLSTLPRLKHLQIQAQYRAVQTGSGFEKLTALETLVLFGKPDAVTLNELATLPSLKSVRIVETDYDDNDPGYDVASGKLRTAIPGIEIEVIPVGDYKPELPENFKAHIEKIRQRALERVRAEMKSQ